MEPVSFIIKVFWHPIIFNLNSVSLLTSWSRKKTLFFFLFTHCRLGQSHLSKVTDFYATSHFPIIYRHPCNNPYVALFHRQIYVIFRDCFSFQHLCARCPFLQLGLPGLFWQLVTHTQPFGWECESSLLQEKLLKMEQKDRNDKIFAHFYPFITHAECQRWYIIWRVFMNYLPVEHGLLIG